MSVQYKESGTWKDISSGSNNAVDTVEDGNMSPITSNAVYDALTTVYDSVYNRLKPKVWTTSINIGTSTWTVTISRSVDMVHVKLRCTASGTATSGANVVFPHAPGWCKLKHTISENTTSTNALLDVQINNSVTYWGGDLAVNSEWNGTELAYDADI